MRKGSVWIKRLLVLITLASALAGCATGGSGQLPTVSGFHPLPEGAAKLALTYSFSLYNTSTFESRSGEEDREKFRDDFQREMEASGFFSSVVEGPADGDVHIDVRQVYGFQVLQMDGEKEFQGIVRSRLPFLVQMLMWETVPSNTYYYYWLKADVSGEKEYDVREAREYRGTTGLVSQFVYREKVRQFHSDVSGNIYRTLLLRMQEDGLLPYGIHSEPPTPADEERQADGFGKKHLHSG